MSTGISHRCCTIQIAEDCGLTTLGEAVLNIDMHCMSIFSYDKINEELKELYSEYKSVVDNYGFDKDTTIEHYLKRGICNEK